MSQEVLVIIQECFEDFEFQRNFEDMCLVKEEKFVYSSDSEVTASDNSDEEL